MSNWVLVRGLARQSGHWGEFAQKFNQSYSSDFIEYLDLRGNGSEVSRKSFLTISDFTDDIRLRSNSLARGEQVNIIAISMGAMVAVDWATRFGREVESITCINTSDGGSSKFWQRLRVESYRPLAKILFNNNSPVVREELTLELITNLLTDKKSMAKKFADLPVTSRENFFRQIYAASRFRFPKIKPECPTTLICSDGDRLVSSECTKNICKMWGLAPVVHASAGHDLPLDDPDWLLRQIKK